MAQDRLDLAGTQRMSEPREFDFTPLTGAARYLVGKPRAAMRFRRQDYSFREQRFRGSSSSSFVKKHDGFGCEDW